MTPANSVPLLRQGLRLGGVERWAFATDTEAMQIPSEIIKCVAFVASKRKSGMHIDGTVFFVGYSIGDSGQAILYAVTARHVVNEAITHGIDHLSHLRLNNREGDPVYGALALDRWIVSDDPRIDVAVAPVEMDFAKFDHLALSMDMFLTDEVIARERIGVGEDLFFPGLFVHRPGEKANIPIVRIGNICAMPGERIHTKFGNLHGYLAEARSIGGLSGSPVFVGTGGIRTLSGAGGLTFSGGISHWLLGLVHGHYGIRDVLDSSDEVLSDSEASKSVNMGIAIIVPADDIRSTLNHPALVIERESAMQSTEAQKASKLPEMD